MDRDLLIKARGIGVNFEGRQILSHIDLEIFQGQLVTLIGPNGAGKTTLVKVVLGLLTPDEGQMERAQGLKIGYMPQKLFVEPTLPLTVERFLKLASPSALDVGTLLEEVRISHLLKQ
ncbi:MAG: ATP-binding cassette domain-containing protein, partial [Pseudohongiella sp.]|nr:ATP-binding cassette domain-containing protein [Pseudohongiella sp.]